MSGDRKLLYYKLTPIFEPPEGTLQSACVQTCLATGKVLSGMGGGGKALAPTIVDALDMTKHDHHSRMIIDADHYDELIALVEVFRDRLEALPAGRKAEPLNESLLRKAASALNTSRYARGGDARAAK